MRGGGKLKERDPLFELVLKWITKPEYDMTLTLREAMAKAEGLIDHHLEEHAAVQEGKEASVSELSRKCPGIGGVFTRLPLIKALDNYSKHHAVEERRFVPPTLTEIRQIFNIAQVFELPGRIQLLTFDADDTLYEHGMDLEPDDWIVSALITLMEAGVSIAVVTAAGYPGRPDRYESRFKGMLSRMREMQCPKAITDNFYCMGGECNYLFRLKEDYTLEAVDDKLWHTPEIAAWDDKDISYMLDTAEAALREACLRMRLDVQFLRKTRAVGCFPSRAEDRIEYEVLEDIALTVQDRLMTLEEGPPTVPFCAFNGNRDVWVDLGSKKFGIEALQQYLGVEAIRTCHMGDRFTSTGNDLRSRDVAMTVWVTDPFETEQYLEVLLRALGDKCKECADARPTGPKQGTEEWKKAQTIQRNTAAT